tara:strand:- start:9063 stop:11654 length:2592 start_codon:yes stop_codon:yes gene_type:complete
MTKKLKGAKKKEVKKKKIERIEIPKDLRKDTAKYRKLKKQKDISDNVYRLYDYQRSPLLFIMDMWGLTPVAEGEKFQKGRHITNHQTELMEAVGKALCGKAKQRITVRSGHGCGKSASLAMLILWYLFSFLDAQIPCTAPGAEQMYDVLWKEIAKWMEKMPPHIKGQYEWTTSYIRMKESPATWFARARTARKESPEALAGMHGEHVMFIVDEACHDYATEVLTRQGWKFFKDLEKDEEVLVMDESGESKYEKVERRIMMPYEGKMYVPTVTRGADFCITPNHDMWLRTVKAGYKKIKPKDIKSDMIANPCINWQGEERAEFRLPAFKSKRGKKEGQVFKMDDWLEFLGWYISEGHLVKRKLKNGKMRYNGVGISQRIPKNRVKIQGLLERMGVSFSVNEKGFIISGIQLGIYLARYGVGFASKRVPRYVMSLPPVQIDVFLKAFMDGDGYMKKKTMVLYTSGEGLANDLHELCLLAGYRTTLKKRSLKGQKHWIIDHWATSTRDGYVISASPPSEFHIRSRAPLATIDYDNMVYCVTVPSGLIYTRRNGYCMWSGNSGVPNEIFNVAEGALTEENILVILIGNPTRTSGYFYDSHHSDKHSWQCLHFDSAESPIVDIKFVNRIIDKHGEDSDEHNIRVSGNFPSEDAIDQKGYVPLMVENDLRYTVDAAFSRGPKRLGVDPSGEGTNETIWVLRDKFKARVVAKEKKSTNKSIAQKTLTLMELYHLNGDDVFVDNFGIGANVSQELALAGVGVNGVNVGDPPDDKERYGNLRAEAFFGLKEWCKKGGALVEDEGWRQLLDIKFKRNLRGRIQIMSKDEMRRSGIVSPDIADAAMLTFTEIDGEYTEGAKEGNSEPFDKFSIC